MAKKSRKKRPGEHSNKPKIKVRKRLLANNEIITRLKEELLQKSK